MLSEFSNILLSCKAFKTPQFVLKVSILVDKLVNGNLRQLKQQTRHIVAISSW